MCITYISPMKDVEFSFGMFPPPVVRWSNGPKGSPASQMISYSKPLLETNIDGYVSRWLFLFLKVRYVSSLEAIWALIFNVLFIQSWFEISEWGVCIGNGYPIPPDLIVRVRYETILLSFMGIIISFHKNLYTNQQNRHTTNMFISKKYLLWYDIAVGSSSQLLKKIWRRLGTS